MRLEVTARGVADLGEQALLQLLDSLFEDADDVLFGIAIAETAEHERHLDAMRSLRVARPAIRDGFHEGLEKALRGDTSALTGFMPPTAENDGADGRDATNAVSSMTIRGLNANRRALFELETRLEWLACRLHSAPVPDALSPRVLCAAFQAALAPVRMTPSVSLLVYKLFDLQVITRLGPVYLVVNDFLIEQGVLASSEAVLGFARAQTRRPRGHRADILTFPQRGSRG